MRRLCGRSGLNSANGDVFKLLFRNHKTQRAARLLVEWIIGKGGYVTPSQLSGFGYRLQKGQAIKGFKYRRSSLYRTVVKRLLTFGFLSLQQVYDNETGRIVYAYMPVKQSIPRRPPLGGYSFWKLAWQICRQWNILIERKTQP